MPSRSPLISCSVLVLVAAGLGPACSDEEVNVPSSDAGADRDAAGDSGGSGGRDAGSDATLDAPRDVTTDGPIGPLTICARLPNVQNTLTAFTPPYIGALRSDCRLGLLTRGQRELDLPAFGNQLCQFNFSFWGCDSRPLAGFHIVYEPTALTPLDVAALIQNYMDRVRPLLGLSPQEESVMRGELQRLGTSAQTSSAQTYSYSECDAGTRDGGDAGDGGEDSGANDAMAADGETDATVDDAQIGVEQ
jgi:hypothetical protein